MVFAFFYLNKILMQDDETYVDKEKDTSNLKEELDPDNDINPDDITADEIPKKKDTITPSQNEIHMVRNLCTVSVIVHDIYKLCCTLL